MSTMNNSPRQWFKQSERPVTEAEAAKGVLVQDAGAELWPHPALCFSLPTFPYGNWDFYWMPADIPAPPKKEETQEEKDHEEYRREMVRCNNDISGETYLPWRLACKYARQTERERLGKAVELICEASGVAHCPLRRKLDALFQPTNTEAK
jgi:hypothetical protein